MAAALTQYRSQLPDRFQKHTIKNSFLEMEDTVKRHVQHPSPTQPAGAEVLFIGPTLDSFLVQ